jgi:hypothetical protein
MRMRMLMAIAIGTAATLVAPSARSAPPAPAAKPAAAIDGPAGAFAMVPRDLVPPSKEQWNPAQETLLAKWTDKNLVGQTVEVVGTVLGIDVSHDRPEILVQCGERKVAGATVGGQAEGFFASGDLAVAAKLKRGDRFAFRGQIETATFSLGDGKGTFFVLLKVRPAATAPARRP